MNLLGRGRGASLFGYTHVYGAVPGGQAEYLRVPRPTSGQSKCPKDPLTSSFSTSPTCCLPPGKPLPTRTFPSGTVGIWGLGPIGQMCARIAMHLAQDA